jgi:hypothetical protein
MAGPRCTVCDHAERKAIEVALAVSSVRDIGGRFGLSKSAVHAHKQRHLPPAVARAAKRREDVGAEALLDKLRDCMDVLDETLENARAKGDFVAVARICKELRETIVRLGQATRGLWSTSPQTVIDNRRQTIAIGQLSLDELRNLARLAPAVSDVDAASLPPRQREPSSSDARGEPLAIP